MVVGAGRLGRALTVLLAERYGGVNVILVEDLAAGSSMANAPKGQWIDFLDKWRVRTFLAMQEITQVYLLPGEQAVGQRMLPHEVADRQSKVLLTVLQLALECKIEQVFWASTMAVFGEGGQGRICDQNCPMEPLSAIGISSAAGERWCRYFHQLFGLDVRSLRLPAVIGGNDLSLGMLQYPMELIKKVITGEPYMLLLKKQYRLPAIYLPDAASGILRLMEAPKNKITVRKAYNVSAFSFTPKELIKAVRRHYPKASIIHRPADPAALSATWPAGIADQIAVRDWGWKPEYDLDQTVSDIVEKLSSGKVPDRATFARVQ